MTERLTDLLHDEALDLAVPAAPDARILARGRTAVRRRRTGVTAGVCASAAVFAAAVVVTLDPAGTAGDLRLATDPAAASPLDPSGWAISAGSTLHLGNGRTAELPDRVKSIYYTSAGTVVRTGKAAYTDAPDSSYALVTDDGKVHSLGLELGDRAPSTDPTLPYLAYAEKRGGIGEDDWTVVLRDVRTGDVAVSVPVHGDFTWGGWNAPPVGLDGDHVYVGLDDATLDVDWRTGEVHEAGHLPGSSFPGVTAGRVVIENGNGDPVSVVDADTGEEVAALPAGSAAGASLSPDGRYALLVPWRNCVDAGDCVYEQPTSQVLDLDGAGRAEVTLGDQVGWTPDGRLIRVTGHEVDLCSASSGSCSPTGIALGSGLVKVGGSSSES